MQTSERLREYEAKHLAWKGKADPKLFCAPRPDIRVRGLDQAWVHGWLSLLSN